MIGYTGRWNHLYKALKHGIGIQRRSIAKRAVPESSPSYRIFSEYNRYFSFMKNKSTYRFNQPAAI